MMQLTDIEQPIDCFERQAAARLPRIRSFYDGIYMLDCAVDKCGDPCPNTATEVGEAVAGTGLIAKVRIGAVDDNTEQRLAALAKPGTRLVVEIAYEPDRQQENYLRVRDMLSKLCND